MGFLKATAMAVTVLSAAAAAAACGALFEQCGGAQYKGVTCCSTGLQCMSMNKWYSQCRPMAPSKGEVKPYRKCGGMGYKGPTACTPGFKCKVIDPSFSHCDVITKRVPTPPVLTPTTGSGRKCANEYKACGGMSHKGPRCCKSGLQCVYLSKWNSQCLAPAPKAGELGPFAQCAGTGFKGPSKCVPAYKCRSVPRGGPYKQCQPLHP